MPDLKVHSDISLASTLPSEFYTDSAVFESAKEKIFFPSWQFIPPGEFPGQPGTAFPFTLLENFLDEPFLLVRDRTGVLRCMSNVCTHRGNILVKKPCSLNRIVCGYHGRSFSLDGKFQSMPEFKEVKNFPTPSDDLRVVSHMNWGPLHFASVKPHASSEMILSAIMERMGWFPVEKLRYSAKHSKDYPLNAHWALYCENYLEGFHIPFVHAGLNQVLEFGNYSTELFPFSNLQLGIAKENEDCFDLPAQAPDYGKKVAAFYFWIFPNLMLNFYPWGLSVNLIQPQTISSTRISFYTYLLDESRLNAGAGADLHSVEMEDEEVVLNVQKGVRSIFYERGRYSVTREQGTHHFHRLIAEFMNR
jgi:choline monooxygenase